MGVDCFVEPLAQFAAHPEGQALLASVGRAVDAAPAAGRFPSANELVAILDDVDEYIVEVVEHRRSWQITVAWEGPQSDQALSYPVILDSHQYGGDPDVPGPFSFYRAEPADVIAVTRRLVPLCGSLVLTMEYGEWIVVDEHTDRSTEWHEVPNGEA